MNAIPTLLCDKNISSVLIVADGNVRRLGLICELEKLLRLENINYEVYEQNTSNPTIDDVEAARSMYVRAKADAVIAIGGGSAIDCAKVNEINDALLADLGKSPAETYMCETGMTLAELSYKVLRHSVTKRAS